MSPGELIGEDEVMTEFYELFENSRSALDETHVRTVGRSMGLNDDEITSMMEKMLDNGTIHEPIQGYYAFTR
jgi:hypothetical protein